MRKNDPPSVAGRGIWTDERIRLDAKRPSNSRNCREREVLFAPLNALQVSDSNLQPQRERFLRHPSSDASTGNAPSDAKQESLP